MFQWLKRIVSDYKELKIISLAEKLCAEIIFWKYKLSSFSKDVLKPNS